MRFGAHSQMFAHDIAEDPAGIIGRVAALGLDAIEIHVADPSSFPVDAVAGAARNEGIEVVLGTALPAERNTISADPATRAAGLAHLRGVIAVAQAVGAAKVCGGVHSANGTFRGRGPSAQEWAWSVEALRAAAVDAAAAEVLLAVEPVSRYSGYFLNTAADAARLTDEVGSAWVAVQLDTWHMNIEEASLPEAIRTAGARLRHLHLVESHRGVPGTGHVPWIEVFTALDEIGYDGLGVFEYFPLSLPTMAARTHTWRRLGTSEEVCTQGMTALRACMRSAKEHSAA